MAITRQQTQVQWTGANIKTVNSAAEVVSDLITLDPTCVGLSVSLYANNANSTPASGDTAVWRIQWSAGDVRADTGDDFDTSEHAQYLTTLDTYSTNVPGENPAQRTIIVDVVAQKFKIAVTCANAATRNVTVSARIEEQRAA